MRPQDLGPYLQKKLATALSQSMKTLAGEALTFTGQRFRQGNWVDTGPQQWQARKPGAKRNRGRALLVDTTELLRGNRYESIGPKGFKLVNRVKYAAVHNYGLTVTRHARSELIVRNRSASGRFRKGTTSGRGITFRGGSFKMPQRQFMGNSFVLRSILRRKALIEITRRMRA